jgi:hypothetical protein
VRRLSHRKTAQAGCLLVVAVLMTVYYFEPGAYTFYPECPLLTWLHVQCPGCGSTRALHALLHGRWAEAAVWNALFPAVFMLAAAWGGVQYASATLRGRFFRLNLPETTYWSAATAAMLFGVLRNLV